MQTESQGNQPVLDDLVHEFLTRWGPVLSGKSLAEALQYPSVSAMRKAESRGKVPVRTFSIEGRRGKFAFTTEVVQWWIEQWRKEQR